jgi:hypothetical protein
MQNGQSRDISVLKYTLYFFKMHENVNITLKSLSLLFYDDVTLIHPNKPLFDEAISFYSKCRVSVMLKIGTTMLSKYNDLLIKIRLSGINRQPAL